MMTICGTLGVYLQFSKTYTVPILGSKLVDRYPNFYSNNIDKYVKIEWRYRYHLDENGIRW